MRSFTADRLRPKWADLAVVLFVLLAAGGLLLAMRPEKGGTLTAVVTVDGAEVARQDLTALSDSVLLEIEGVKYPITVEFAPGMVRIHDTACPGGDCKASGWADSAGEQIVCLPNRLAVSVTGEKTSDIDAVSG